jgi:hypothetical protein
MVTSRTTVIGAVVVDVGVVSVTVGAVVVVVEVHDDSLCSPATDPMKENAKLVLSKRTAVTFHA